MENYHQSWKRLNKVGQKWHSQCVKTCKLSSIIRNLMNLTFQENVFASLTRRSMMIWNWSTFELQKELKVGEGNEYFMKFCEIPRDKGNKSWMALGYNSGLIRIFNLESWAFYS